MKSLLLLIMLMSGIQANEWDFTGKTTTILSNYETNDIVKGKNSEQIYAQTLQLNIDYNNGNFHFQATPFAYKYGTNSNEPIKYRNWAAPYDSYDVWFRSLYATYTVGNWSIGAGVLPFSNSSPTKFNDDYIEDGEGVLLINDSVLTSVFVVHRYGNSKTIFGAGTPYHLIVNTGNYIDPTLREDAYSIFLINTYKIEKWEIISEYLYNDIRYNQKQLAEDHLIGATISWDDSENSGLSLYGTAAGCFWDGKQSNSKDEIYNTYFSDNDYGLPASYYGEIVKSKYPDNFALEDQKSYGAAHMLGVRQDFDIGTKEFFINAEWMRTYGNYISGNQGTFYLGKNNQFYNIRDNSYYIQVGWIVNENLRFRLSHEMVEMKREGKIGNPGLTVPVEQSLRAEKINRINVTNLIMTYKF